MTWVKVCGTTNLEDALVAVEAGANALGFVFYDKSPRYVTPEAVREIVQHLPERVEKVGVFVNESPDRMEEIAERTGLTAIQLHGEEYRGEMRPLGKKKTFMAIPARELLGDAALRFRFQEPVLVPRNLSGVILDSGNQQQRGGTGIVFDWRALWSVIGVLGEEPLIVAGGLTPENVGEMMGILKPWGVDVVSGVEREPGKKDPAKVKAFVDAVRRADGKR